MSATKEEEQQRDPTKGMSCLARFNQAARTLHELEGANSSPFSQAAKDILIAHYISACPGCKRAILMYLTLAEFLSMLESSEK